MPFAGLARSIATLWRTSGLASDAVNPHLSDRYLLSASAGRREHGAVDPGALKVGRGPTTVRVTIVAADWGQESIVGRLARAVARCLKAATQAVDSSATHGASYGVYRYLVMDVHAVQDPGVVLTCGSCAARS